MNGSVPGFAIFAACAVNLRCERFPAPRVTCCGSGVESSPRSISAGKGTSDEHARIHRRGLAPQDGRALSFHDRPSGSGRGTEHRAAVLSLYMSFDTLLRSFYRSLLRAARALPLFRYETNRRLL